MGGYTTVQPILYFNFAYFRSRGLFFIYLIYLVYYCYHLIPPLSYALFPFYANYFYCCYRVGVKQKHGRKGVGSEGLWAPWGLLPSN